MVGFAAKLAQRSTEKAGLPVVENAAKVPHHPLDQVVIFVPKVAQGSVVDGAFVSKIKAGLTALFDLKIDVFTLEEFDNDINEDLFTKLNGHGTEKFMILINPWVNGRKDLHDRFRRVPGRDLGIPSICSIRAKLEANGAPFHFANGKFQAASCKQCNEDQLTN